MRSAALAGLAVCLFAPHALAQQPPYRATVIDQEVTVRPAPSASLGDTGTLKRGEDVIVERDDGSGWLAIRAPYGSVSWISALFLDEMDPNKPTPKWVTVHADTEVTLAAGKAGLEQPLDIRRVKIPDGSGVLVIGPKLTIGNKTWYPIQPPAGDVRYIPKTSVQFVKPAPDNFTVRAADSSPPIPPAAVPVATPPLATLPPAGAPIATVAGPGSSPAPAGAVVASKPAVNHPLWIKAETAEREGRLVEAEKAYFELAALMNGPGGDIDVANLCFTRIHALRERNQASNTGGQAAKDNRAVRPGAPQAVPTGSSARSNPNPTPGATSSDRPPDWIGPGTLRVAAITLGGPDQKTYALETAPGAVRIYVLAGAGVDLASWVGKKVLVYGTPQTRSGISKQYVVAMGVEDAPK